MQKQNYILEKFQKLYRKYRLTRFRLLLLFLGAAALVVILEGFNSPHLSPAARTVTLDHPCSLSAGESGSVIADRQHTRLIFMNNNQEAYAFVSLKNPSSPINWVSDVWIDGDDVYVLGAVKTNQGLYLESESIQVYNLSGKYDRELYKNTYDDASMETDLHLLTLWMDKGNLKTAGYKDGAFYIQTVSSTGRVDDEKTFSCPSEILSAEYLDGKVYAFGRDGLFYIVDETAGSLVAFDSSENDLTYIDQFHLSSQAMEKLSVLSPLHKTVLQTSADGSPKDLFCMTTNDPQLFRYHFEDREFSEISTISLSPVWAAKNIFFWAFVLYAVVMAVLGLYRLLIVKKKFLQWRSFLLLVMIAALVTGIYSYYSYSRLKESFTEEISVLGNQVTAELQNGYGDILSDVSNDGLSVYSESESGKQRLEKLEGFLSHMCLACGKKVGFYLNVQAVQKDGSTLLLAESRKTMYCGSLVQTALSGFEGTSSKCEITDVNGRYLAERFAVRNASGEVQYIVESGCYKGNLLQQLRTEAINLLFNLLAVLITLWITFSLIRDFPKSIRDYKTKVSQNDPDAPVVLSGIFTFIHQMILLIDGIVQIYVVRSMLTGYDSSLVPVVTAFLMALFNIGMGIGNLIFFQLRIRIGEQKTGVFASVGGVCCYTLMAAAVSTDSLGYLLLGKWLSGIFVGSFLLNLARGLPLDSKNEKTRIIGLNENQQAFTAGYVLANLMAGYLSQITYSAVYLAGAALCVPLIFLSLKAFQPGINMEVRNWYFDMKQRTKGIKGLIKRLPWMFYKKRTVLPFIVFYTFPFVLSNGYQTYLFPLYSAGVGLSTLVLSNIVVFGQAIAYFSNPLVVAVSGNWDRLKKMIGYMVILSVCFLFFAISPNIWWAIVVLYIQFILLRIPRVGTTVYLSELAEQEGYFPRTVQPTYYSIEGIFNVVQAPILRSFISLGVNYACSGLGIFCGVFVSIFGILTGRRRKKAVKDHEESE